MRLMDKETLHLTCGNESEKVSPFFFLTNGFIIALQISRTRTYSNILAPNVVLYNTN